MTKAEKKAVIANLKAAAKNAADAVKALEKKAKAVTRPISSTWVRNFDTIDMG
jgi:peptidoglycan hydrolase CwlO-like protein